MKFSENWLREWVSPELESGQLIELLTMSGLEVDGVEPVAGEFSGVVIARIEAAEPHPDADRLQVCRVSTGSGEPVQIVCGAPNARAGLHAPLACVGAVLPGGFKIKKAKLRGVVSQGMLCSIEELGMGSDAEGLFELPENAPPGVDLREWLALDDETIDLDLTPNRSDCLGIKGIAREVGALTDTEVSVPLMVEVAAQHQRTFPVRLSAPQGCAKYVGRVVEGIDVKAATPLWIAEKLRRCGLRSISPTVDVTNYVMLELGQPMHAFDLDRLNGGIEVREARAGEKLVLLDGKEVVLNEGLLLICDAQGPVAIAGIMGGLQSGVSDTTTSVFLESAWFSPAAIMGKARDLGMHTDSSHRFERGVDSSLQHLAMERATALLIEIAGGKAGPIVEVEDRDNLPAERVVSLRAARLERVLGSSLDERTVTGILKRLGMSPRFEQGVWHTHPPMARVDIEIEEDLIEEVARVYGYNNLPADNPGGKLIIDSVSETQIERRQFAEVLIQSGFQEAINYSFVSREDLARVAQESDAVALANPLSEEMTVMRTTLLPGLINALVRNLNRQHSRVRLFETGVSFHQQGQGTVEVPRLCAVACGTRVAEQWGLTKLPMDFFDLKGVVERLCDLSAADAEFSFQRTTLPWLHPGRAAELHRNGEVVGWLGSIHPKVTRLFGCKPELFAFEFSTAELSCRSVPKCSEVSRFPSIRRDLALIVPENVTFDQVRESTAIAGGELLQSTRLFDLYVGEGVESGFKSIAISLILQESSRTLVDAEVDQSIDQIVKCLADELGAKLRG